MCVSDEKRRSAFTASAGDGRSSSCCEECNANSAPPASGVEAKPASGLQENSTEEEMPSSVEGRQPSEQGSTTDDGSSSEQEEPSGAPNRISRKRKAKALVVPSEKSAIASSASQSAHPDLEFVGECDLPTNNGDFRLRAYRWHGRQGTGRQHQPPHEPVVMIAGDVRGQEAVAVRVHDQCQTSEVLGSRRCDCKEQLDIALRHVHEHDGAVIYLQQEGRGIGLANKVAAYALQDGGLDTVDANRALGFSDDERSYDCVAPILADMGVRSIWLMTNNPLKVESLEGAGVRVVGRLPVLAPPNADNARYLQAKAARMRHLLDGL